MTPDDAKNFLNHHYGAWKAALTPAQDKGMRFYQSPGFVLMNGQLRGLAPEQFQLTGSISDGDLARAKIASKNLAAAIKAAPPLTKPMTVFRAFSANQFGKLAVGQTITDKAFVSVSLLDDAGTNTRAGAQATAVIALPSGTRAAAGSAREMVLPPGSSFKIVSITPGTGGPVIEMEHIPK